MDARLSAAGFTTTERTAVVNALKAHPAIWLQVASAVEFVEAFTIVLVVGFLLVLFGLKWLKKAILCHAGPKAMHDEEAIYEEQAAEMRSHNKVTGSYPARLHRRSAQRHPDRGPWRSRRRRTGHRRGSHVRAPLERVPENTLKDSAGILLTTFGTFWGGEGLGIKWWHEDLVLPILAALYLIFTYALVRWLRAPAPRAPDISSISSPEPEPVTKTGL
jgi:uncharacterized membrane protein